MSVLTPASDLAVFEYEIAAEGKRPFWKLWLPKDKPVPTSISATIAARSEQQAIDALAARPNFANQLTSFRRLSPLEARIRRALFRRRVPPELVLDFIGNFATMTEDGDVTPAEACETMAEMTIHPYMRVVIETIGSLVGKSAKLWEACSFFPDVFDRYVVSIIRSGEDKGAAIMHTVLHDLESELESKGTMRALQGAIRSDMLQVGISVLMMVLAFLVYFIPVIVAKPAGTRASWEMTGAPWWLAWLLPISALMQNPFFDVAIALLLIGAYGLFRVYITTPGGRFWWDRQLIYRFGEYSEIMRLHTQADVMQAFARLYEISVDPYEAWTEAARTSNNAIYEEAFIEVRDRIQRGVALAQALKDTGLINPRALTRIRAAEPNGPDVLAKRMLSLAKDFRSESFRRLEKLNRSIHTSAQYVFAVVIVAVLFFATALFANALVNLHG